MNDEFERWLEGRPEQVKALAREFPPKTSFEDIYGRGIWWVLGYTENDCLILTPVNPGKDYEGAHTQKFYVHAQCMRDAINKSKH